MSRPLPPGRVLITGGTGFIGRHLIRCLQERGWTVLATRRHAHHPPQLGPHHWVEIASIGPDTDWSRALAGVDVVVHLAGLAHVAEDRGAEAARYYRINTEGTLTLARAAAQAGVRRLVYLSTVKVHGARDDDPEARFTEDSPAHPQDPYSDSKWQAELGLRRIGRESSLETAVIRPCLVYGPGVKANFLALMDWIASGRPVPACRRPAVRSMIGISNLCDLIAHCLVHPAAADQAFLASDGEDLSTCELARMMARSLGRRARCLILPRAALATTGRLLGRPLLRQRLCSSLRVDASKAHRLLGWRPPMSIHEELRRTARWYIALRDMR